MARMHYTVALVSSKAVFNVTSDDVASYPDRQIVGHPVGKNLPLKLTSSHCASNMHFAYHPSFMK